MVIIVNIIDKIKCIIFNDATLKGFICYKIFIFSVVTKILDTVYIPEVCIN